MTLKIKTTDFLDASIETYSQKFLDIATAINTNVAIFTNCPYSVTALEDAAGGMAQTTSAAKEGGREERNARNQQRTLCDTILLTLSNYVLTRASQEPTLEQQIAIVDLSKFVLAKTPAPTPPLPQVTGVAGKWTGNTGELLIQWKKIAEGARVYKVQKCFSDPAQQNAVWVDAGETSHRKIVLAGFTPLTICWVRVIACGKGTEKSVPSDPAMCVVG